MVKSKPISCHGPCCQGRRECPTPSACELSEDTTRELHRVMSTILYGAVLALSSVALFLLLA